MAKTSDTKISTNLRLHESLVPLTPMTPIWRFRLTGVEKGSTDVVLGSWSLVWSQKGMESEFVSCDSLTPARALSFSLQIFMLAPCDALHNLSIGITRNCSRPIGHEAA